MLNYSRSAAVCTTINVFPALKEEDFHGRRVTFHPGNQDVPSSIDVTILDRSALVAPPLPYSKRAQPFRAACGDHPAGRARLGTVSFGNHAHHAAIDLYDSMLRSIDQPASPTDFAIGVFASVFGLTSAT